MASRRVSTLAEMASALERVRADLGRCSASAIEVAVADRFSIRDEATASVRSAMTANPDSDEPMVASNRSMVASASARSAMRSPGRSMLAMAAMGGRTAAS
jgi:hypothetical protein